MKIYELRVARKNTDDDIDHVKLEYQEEGELIQAVQTLAENCYRLGLQNIYVMTGILYKI